MTLNITNVKKVDEAWEHFYCFRMGDGYNFCLLHGYFFPQIVLYFILTGNYYWTCKVLLINQLYLSLSFMG